MTNVAIIIPVYKENLTHNETIAYQQAKRVFCRYDLFFLSPKSLSICYADKDIEILRFEDRHFKGVQEYSDFMLDVDLYKAMEQYEYILIYQLDAFVFEDRLDFFCREGYDYIGAPSFLGAMYFCNGMPEQYIQNGGFSLRKTRAFIDWIEQEKAGIEFHKRYSCEDSIIYKYKNSVLNLPSFDVALHFSIDSEVKEQLRRLDGELPMGCHAWDRYEVDIWKPIIEQYGYTVEYGDPRRRLIYNYFIMKDQLRKWQNRYNTEVLRSTIKKLISDFEDEIFVWGMARRGGFLHQMLVNTNIAVKYVDNRLEAVKLGMYPYSAITGEEFWQLDGNKTVIVAIDNPVDVCIELEQNGIRHRKGYTTYLELMNSLEEYINMEETSFDIIGIKPNW